MCKAFLVEVKWCHNSQIPTFEDYINNGWVSVSGSVILTHAYFMVSLDITPEALDCLNNNHNILRLPSIVFRLSNDLATFEVYMHYKAIFVTYGSRHKKDMWWFEGLVALSS